MGGKFQNKELGELSNGFHCYCVLSSSGALYCFVTGFPAVEDQQNYMFRCTCVVFFVSTVLGYIFATEAVSKPLFSLALMSNGASLGLVSAWWHWSDEWLFGLFMWNFFFQLTGAYFLLDGNGTVLLPVFNLLCAIGGRGWRLKFAHAIEDTGGLDVSWAKNVIVLVMCLVAGTLAVSVNGFASSIDLEIQVAPEVTPDPEFEGVVVQATPAPSTSQSAVHPKRKWWSALRVAGTSRVVDTSTKPRSEAWSGSTEDMEADTEAPRVRATTEQYVFGTDTDIGKTNL